MAFEGRIYGPKKKKKRKKEKKHVELDAAAVYGGARSQ